MFSTIFLRNFQFQRTLPKLHDLAKLLLVLPVSLGFSKNLKIFGIHDSGEFTIVCWLILYPHTLTDINNVSPLIHAQAIGIYPNDINSIFTFPFQPILYLVCSELLHKAAFRDTLGNSLFADEHRLGDWNIDIIERFIDHTFTANKSLLVGLSVNHDNLVHLAEKFKIRPPKEANLPKTVYRGGWQLIATTILRWFACLPGESRKELPLDFATSAIVWEAPGFNNIKEGLATSILAGAIDSGVNLHIKSNNGELELIKRVIKDPKVNEKCVANSIYTSYSDTGLLGFTVFGCPKVQQEAIGGLHKHFATIGQNGISTQEFDVAK